LVSRTKGIDAHLADAGAAYAYVVGTHHEELVRKGGGGCFVEPGLLKVKLPLGAAHPLVRAVGVDTRTLFDGTLGLAHDALHLAHAIPGLRITGAERSAVLFALLEDGLARLGVADRIRPAHGDALEALQAMADGSVDVVFLDPMMSRPKGSTPTFEVLRAFAWGERASPALLAEAARVAARRVVLKLGRGAPLPPGCPLAFGEHHRGAHVTYHVHHVGRVEAARVEQA
jgi:hypothetical protein